MGPGDSGGRGGHDEQRGVGSGRGNLCAAAQLGWKLCGNATWGRRRTKDLAHAAARLEEEEWKGLGRQPTLGAGSVGMEAILRLQTGLLRVLRHSRDVQR